MNEARLPSEHGSYFAFPGRSTPGEVREQVSLCLEDPIVQTVLSAVDSYAVLLNAKRQIVAANGELLGALPAEQAAEAYGLRLGEALGCIHVSEGSDGCGSSRACHGCGALQSMLATQGTGQTCSGECLISMKREDRWEAREFTARAMPLTVAGQQMTLLTLRDISALKRRENLERVFIHDLMGSIQEIRGWTEVMQGAGAEIAVIAGQVLELTGRFTAEVAFQHRLLQAECGELVPEFHPMTPERIVDRVEQSLGEGAARLMRHPMPPEPCPVRTDPTILCDILHNMVLNALEATPMGGQVWIWHERREGRPLFVVHNPGYMPTKVSDQVFKRSFSTKAPHGRGLGTYGMKLLGETVLGGKVGFTTGWEEGTRFFIELPVDA